MCPCPCSCPCCACCWRSCSGRPCFGHLGGRALDVPSTIADPPLDLCCFGSALSTRCVGCSDTAGARWRCSAKKMRHHLSDEKLERAPLHRKRQPEGCPVAVVVHAAGSIEFDLPDDLLGCPEHHILADERRFVLVAIGNHRDVHWLGKPVAHHTDVFEQVLEVTPVFDRSPHRRDPLMGIFVHTGAPKHEKAGSRSTWISAEGFLEPLAEHLNLAVWS